MAAHRMKQREIDNLAREYERRLQAISFAKVAYFKACLSDDHAAAEICWQRVATLEYNFSLWFKCPVHPESADELKARLQRRFQSFSERDQNGDSAYRRSVLP